MINQQAQQELKHQLVLLTDAYIKLSENPAWQLLVEKFPELENARHAAICASDAVWWQVRTKIN